MCAVAIALGTIIQQTRRTATAGHPLKTQHAVINRHCVFNLVSIGFMRNTKHSN